MPELDKIRRLAQQALCQSTPAGLEDTWLWDRTLRILRNVENICRLPELAGQAMAIDRFCLIAATCFANAGLAHFAEAKALSARLVLADICLPDLCSSSTRVVSDRLAGTMPGPRIDRINRIITESSNCRTRVTEAMILSDARNLDDMGAVGLYNECRRYVLHGKSASDIIESWKRKIDYRYWQARLKESFHFAAVRRLAEQRFAAAESFMNQLIIENTAEDLEALLRESPDRKQFG